MPTTPNRKDKAFKYSYSWAQEVVEAFMERTSRGTEAFCKIAGVSRNKLAYYLIYSIRMDNQLAWRAQKAVIKQMEHENVKDYMRLPLQERRKYLTYVKWFSQDDILDDEDDSFSYGRR